MLSRVEEPQKVLRLLVVLKKGGYGHKSGGNLTLFRFIKKDRINVGGESFLDILKQYNLLKIGKGLPTYNGLFYCTTERRIPKQLVNYNKDSTLLIIGMSSPQILFASPSILTDSSIKLSVNFFEIHILHRLGQEHA